MRTELENNIIGLLQTGDKKALTLLYDHYSSALFGVALKITNNEALAEDALQESFVKIWKNSDKYDPAKAKLFTWLYRIVRNTAIDKIRSSKNRSDKEVQINTSNVYTIPSVNFNQDALDIRKHVDNLEPKYKIVIEALFFEGMTHQEASEELNIPLGTIKSRLKIALRELKGIYDVK